MSGRSELMRFVLVGSAATPTSLVGASLANGLPFGGALTGGDANAHQANIEVTAAQV